VIAGRRLNVLEIVEKELKTIDSSVQVLTSQTDISSEEQVKALYASVQSTFGRPADVLLNNAGVLDDALIADQTVERWWKTMEINVKGLLIMVKGFIESQGEEKKKEPVGTIISVLTGRVGLTTPAGSSYNVSKSTEMRLVEHMQLGESQIFFFNIYPSREPSIRVSRSDLASLRYGYLKRGEKLTISTNRISDPPFLPHHARHCEIVNVKRILGPLRSRPCRSHRNASPLLSAATSKLFEGEHGGCELGSGGDGGIQRCN
jgi:NAD(P)-dependent dehydrogenase (short-subunit alcohol dehydrogenase family)